MTKLFKQELRELASFFKRNYREIVVIGFSALFLTLAGYHPIGPPWISSLIYFAVLPILTITVILRRNPLDFGLRLGNFKVWGFYVIATLIVALPILYIASRS